MLKLFVQLRAEPLSTVRQCPAGTPAHSEGASRKQPRIHQQTPLQKHKPIKGTALIVFFNLLFIVWTAEDALTFP